MKPIDLRRTQLTLRPDPGRVLVRPLNLANEERARTICRRVLALPEPEVRALLAQVQAEFGNRHPETRAFLKRRFEEVGHCGLSGQDLSDDQGVVDRLVRGLREELSRPRCTG